jgi:hypothetical protein
MAFATHLLQSGPDIRIVDMSSMMIYTHQASNAARRAKSGPAVARSFGTSAASGPTSRRRMRAAGGTRPDCRSLLLAGVNPGKQFVFDQYRAVNARLDDPRSSKPVITRLTISREAPTILAMSWREMRSRTPMTP